MIMSTELLYKSNASLENLCLGVKLDVEVVLIAL